jgi:hypothetical protein
MLDIVPPFYYYAESRYAKWFYVMVSTLLLNSPYERWVYTECQYDERRSIECRCFKRRCSFKPVFKTFQDEDDDDGAVGHEYYDDPTSFASTSTSTSLRKEAAETANLLGDDFNDDIPETADLLGS